MTILPASGEQVESTKTQLYKCLKERRSIQSGELIVESRISHAIADLNSDGSRWKYHIWFNMNPNIYRVDREIEGSGLYDRKIHIDRFCYDGSSFKIIDEAQTLQRVREYSYIPNPAPSAFDPRVLGLVCVPILAIGNFGLDSVKDIVEKSVSIDAYEKGGLINEKFMLNRDDYEIFSFDHIGNLTGVVTFYKDSSEQSARSEIQMQRYDDSLSFPKKIHTVLRNSGVLAFDDETEIKIIQINQPIDHSIFLWKSLSPNPGVRLEVNNDINHLLKYWDGEKFRDVPSQFVKNLSFDLIEYQNRSRRILLSVVSLSLVALVLIALYIYRLKISRRV